jgi:hypothetical protein
MTKQILWICFFVQKLLKTACLHVKTGRFNKKSRFSALFNILYIFLICPICVPYNRLRQRNGWKQLPACSTAIEFDAYLTQETLKDGLLNLAFFDDNIPEIAHFRYKNCLFLAKFPPFRPFENPLNSLNLQHLRSINLPKATKHSPCH